MGRHWVQLGLGLAAIALWWATRSGQAQSPAPEWTAADFGLSADSVEIPEQRNAHAVHFRKGTSSVGTAVISTGRLNYENSPGVWKRKRWQFVSDGNDDASTDNDVIVRLTDTTPAIEVTDRVGRGVRFALPARATRTGIRTFRAGPGGLTLDYTLLPDGIKAQVTVPTRLGARAWTVPIAALGGAIPTIAPDGSLVIGTFRVARPVAIGANGVTYSVGAAWTIVDATHVRVSLDDGSIPDTALPYVLDPTTTFETGDNDDVPMLGSDGATLPIASGGCGGTDLNSMAIGREVAAGPVYSQRTLLLQWDTSSLAGQVVTGATLRMYANQVFDGADALSQVIEAYDWGGTCDASDWATAPVAPSSPYYMGAKAIGTFDDFASNDIPLTNNLNNIKRTGTTRLRMTTTCPGGDCANPPSSSQYTKILGTEAGSGGQLLLVDYYTPARTACYNRSSATWAQGTVCAPGMQAGAALIGNDGNAASWWVSRRTVAMNMSAASVDGAQCLRNEAQINSGRRRVSLICTDNDAGIWWGGREMPAGYGGDTIRFILSALSVNATPSGTLQIDCKCQCRGSGTTIDNTWGTAQSVTLTFATQYAKVEGISAATVCDGTCAVPGSSVELGWRCNVNAAGTTATMSDVRIVDGGVQYATGGSDG